LSILSGVNVFVACLSLFKFRRSAFLAPIFFILAYAIYSILIGRYLFPEIGLIINEVIDYEYDFLGLLLIFLFTTFLSLQVKEAGSNIYKMVPVDASYKNVVVSLVCLVVGVSSQFIFSTIIPDSRSGYSPMYEYSIVFYIVSLFYSLNTKYFKCLVLVVLFLMILRDFSLGHRATATQISLLIYVLVLSRYYTFKRFLSFFVIATLLMNSVSIYRRTFSYEFDTFFSELGYLITSKYLAVDTAYFAYVASLTFLSVHDMVSFSEIVSDLWNFIVSLVIVGTYGESLYTISKEYYPHSNGGILPLYMFYYFSYFAIPLITTVLAFYFNLIAKGYQSTLKSLIFIYIFVTMPRWILYAPTQLFRGVSLFFLVVLAVFVFKNLLNILNRNKDIQ
jgi:hypothetical protein